MKGIVFRALMGVAEQHFGPVMVEKMLDDAQLPRHGAYTTVGHYPIEEFHGLVRALTRVSGAAEADILRECGRRTIAYVIDTQARERKDPFGLEEMLRSLQDLIHAHYVKLYPDSILPTLKVSEAKGTWITLDYSSPRPLADLAEGLILGTLDHLKVDTEMKRQDLPPFDGRAARFFVAIPAAG